MPQTAGIAAIVERGIELELRRGVVTIKLLWPTSGGGGAGALHARAAAVIRVNALCPAVEPLDMRAGTEAALTRVVNVFGAAPPQHADLSANRCANRMKVLVHDGIGVWPAARCLNSGKFSRTKDISGTLTLTTPQLDALLHRGGLLCSRKTQVP